MLALGQKGRYYGKKTRPSSGKTEIAEKKGSSGEVYIVFAFPFFFWLFFFPAS